MKILFLVKFYPPFDRGGSEWSTHDLAYLLSKKGHKVSILTPNYGAKQYEKLLNTEIFRFPFPLKLKKKYHQPAPWWTNNIFWILFSTYFCFKHVIHDKVDIIHVHSNEFIPAAVIVGLITRKPTVATFRDYQVICNLGFCLWHKNKSCSISEYIRSDIRFFLKNYSQSSNGLLKVLIFAALLRAKFYQQILKFFAAKINFKIAVSQKVKEIFTKNGFKNIQVINNPIIISPPVKVTKENTIICTGKLSKGKGVDLLFRSLPQVFKQTSASNIEIVGSGHLFDKLKKMTQNSKLSSKIKFTGHIAHDEVLKKVSRASITVVPSVWPEPLPRTIIESILCQTPVVATDVGGNREIIKDNVYGKICKPDTRSLTKAIILTWGKRKAFMKNLYSDIQIIQKKYSSDVLVAYEKIYKLSLK